METPQDSNLKISFDAATLARIVAELQPLVGGQIQRIAQPQPLQVVLSVFKSSVGEKHLLIDLSARFYRAHLTTIRTPKSPSPPPFCMTLRKYLDGGRILSISQRDGDRILDLKVQNDGQEFLLSAELMGKHANLILVSPEGTILQAAKLITSKQSRVREVLPGREYTAPPTRPFSDTAQKGKDEASAINSPLLDEYYARAQARDALEQQKSSLLGSLKKALQQKTRALGQVRRGAVESTRADEFQKFGDLILSQMHAIEPQAEAVELTDYYSPDAATILISLDPDLSSSENAQKYFQKARRARESADELQQLQMQLESEVAAIEAVKARAESADSLEALGEIREIAQAKNWLRAANESAGSGGKQQDAGKPDFGGHKIKRLSSPDGYEIYIGENATANDYLVTRLSHGNDWWLHLRGGTSSHAIIRTNNAPERVPLSTLLFAARLVVARSIAKHAGWAEVDYTLRKYVRKPRKAAPGSVVISNQKTLRVEPEK